jgi:valine--pyruvate aminotransferase
MNYSKFGKRFSTESGIVELMTDLGDALNVNPDMIFMGGGNPAAIPAMQTVFADQLQALVNDPQARHKMLGVYQSPQGDEEFLDALAELLHSQFGWPLTRANIALSNGSQSAFFLLFNMLAGESDNNAHKYIQLPLAPEYLGYGDVGLSDNLFRSAKPTIEYLDNNQFKYHVDFKNLNIDEDCAALCVSRPTNPTGNVLTNDEITQLDRLAREHEIPLIIDSAYGTPFPNILFAEARPHWNENTIVVLSLSKLGLPGARTGIVVGTEQLIKDFANANTLSCLASGNLGPAIAKPLLRSGEILRLSNEVVKPFYQERSQLALKLLQDGLEGLPCYVHKPEGAIFLWLWCKGLPISSQELYLRLKQRGVLVVAGHHFFIGLDVQKSESWRHVDECLRISYCLDESKMAEGMTIVADEIRKAYRFI